MEVMDYFREMSPLAARVTEDIDLTKSAYQDIWSTLNQKEQDQVINEALIDPAAVLKYHSNHVAEGKVKPYSKFTWFTKSQLNLCSFHEKSETAALRKKSPCKKGPAPEPPVVFIPPSPVAAKVKRAAIASPPCEPNNLFTRLKSRRSEDKQPLVDPGPVAVVVPVRVSKPKTPPPPPPSHESVALLSVDEIDLSIPKTGFDFLDNW